MSSERQILANRDYSRTLSEMSGSGQNGQRTNHRVLSCLSGFLSGWGANPCLSGLRGGGTPFWVV